MEQMQPFTGTVVLFPLSWRHALVRQTAARVLKQNGDQADKLWRLAVGRLRRDLSALGFLSPDEIEDELHSFAVKVDEQIRQSRDGYYDGSAA